MICEIVNDDGTMMRAPRAARVRRRARPADDLDRRPGRATAAAPRRSVERVARDASCRPRTASSRAVGYRSTARRRRARRAGRAATSATATDVLVRVHSECLTGDVFGSLRCDCGPQLDAALDAVAAEGRGVVLYLRGHEGRGIGLHAQAAGLPAAGRRRRHRRREPRARPAGRRPRLRHRRADPRATSASARCGC